MADNGDPTQYDPRAQAFEEIHFHWRTIVCCMVALSHFHLEQQHLPGTDSAYFDIDVTNVTPHFICSVGSGNHFKLLDQNAPSTLSYHCMF